ncbi:MAG TPA: Kdo hydroxylase family protein [Xanthomonadaceae bacterium]|nr:Kdo hydroxylase family protein [Xanthomonadaceae bacterium]
MLETFDLERLRSAARFELGDALEDHRIVFFPECPFPLPDAADLDYLRRELPGRLKLKNVSFHPEADRVRGMDAGEDLDRVGDILRSHSAAVTKFLGEHMGHLTRGWRIGTCSFRPIQEKGRDLKPHASNELVHVDAGAYGASNGDRIFRFFVNVNPSEDRVWATKGDFALLLERFGREAGLLDEAGRLKGKLDKGTADRLFSGLVAGLARLNPMAKMVDSSPYDRLMRRFHNYMKDSPEFIADMRDFQEIRFPPGSAWMVFTDGVSHASLEGQFAFVTTCIIPRGNLRHPERAPYAVLSQAAA